MGLSFRHLDIQSSYTGFAYFRRMLADSMGWKYYGDTFFYEWHRHSEVEKFRSDPMFVFMMHSDCDGFISPSDCLKIAPRLRELVKDWKDWDEENYTREGGWKRYALELADGMESLAAKGKKLVFC
jgi:hypothetical protein